MMTRKMKYNAGTTPIPQDQRADINEKILALIHSTDMQGITAQDVFEGYTGVGGLHGLNRNEFNNYVAFSDAKKEIENGQFFTPAAVVQEVANILTPGTNEILCDITCGAGAFFKQIVMGASWISTRSKLLSSFTRWQILNAQTLSTTGRPSSLIM
jgi:type I restriction-modification system DNA methylase subunit